MSNKQKYVCSRCGKEFESDKKKNKEENILCPECQAKQDKAKKNETLLNIRNLLADEITRLSDFSPGGAYLEYFDEITYLNDKDKQSRIEMSVRFEILLVSFFNQQKETVQKKTYNDYDWIAILAALYEAYHTDYSDIA